MKTASPDKKMLRYRNLILKKAISDYCQDCNNWPYAKPSQCQTNACPLHPYRTGKGKQEVTQKETAITEFCLKCMGTIKDVNRCQERWCDLWLFRTTPLIIDDTEDEIVLEDLGMDEEEFQRRVLEILNSPESYIPPSCPCTEIEPTPSPEEDSEVKPC